MGALDKPQFFDFLKVDLPEPIPKVDKEIREKKIFLTFVNELAKDIKDRSEHYLYLYLGSLPTYGYHFRIPRARYPRVLGHGKQITTWTRYGHNVQARHHCCPSALLEGWCRALAICSTCRGDGI